LILKFFSKIFPLIRRKKKERNEFFEYRLNSIKDLVGTSIKNSEIFIQALTHRSALYIDHIPSLKLSNERLEFLGDSVLNLIVSDYVFNNLKELDEGILTKIRSRFVNKSVLADVAQKINLTSLLIISENTASAIESGGKSVISDALEALIGAIYIDMGYDVAKNFVYKFIISPNLYLVHDVDQNYKSQLLEYAQANKLDLPKYEVIKEEGPDHSKIFTVQVSIDGKPLGIGKGSTKKIADQEAAYQALLKIKHNSIS